MTALVGEVQKYYIPPPLYGGIIHWLAQIIYDKRKELTAMDKIKLLQPNCAKFPCVVCGVRLMVVIAVDDAPDDCFGVLCGFCGTTYVIDLEMGKVETISYIAQQDVDASRTNELIQRRN